MTGNIVVKNLKKLHAFNLAENYLNLEDVATMRFYGSQNAKAFQDEADLYFDNEYIYSARVPKLFFIRNGQWQMLKETALPGAIEISSQVKDFEVDLNNVKYKAPKMIFPVKAGLQSLILSAPGYLPYVEVGVLLEGDALQIKPSFLKIENTPDTTKKLSVTLDEIASTQGLDNTEKLYDKYVAEDTEQLLGDHPHSGYRMGEKEFRGSIPLFLHQRRHRDNGREESAADAQHISAFNGVEAGEGPEIQLIHAEGLCEAAQGRHHFPDIVHLGLHLRVDQHAYTHHESDGQAPDQDRKFL